VHAVYEKDAFEFELGDDPFIRHKPHLGDDRGKLIAVYSVATLKSGEKSRDVMSVSEVEKIRALSKGKNTPWNNPTFYPEMAKKTVARRHSKVLPMSSDLDDLIRRDDELYDLKGAKEDAKEVRPRSLADRLDQIAGEPDADPDTGEVIDHEQKSEPDTSAGSEGGKASPQGKAADKPSSDNPPRSDEGNPIATARRRGAEARDKGMSRKAVPKEYRSDERLMAAYLDGFDTGEAEDREPGEDEED
jgi:recombination protein RecT